MKYVILIVALLGCNPPPQPERRKVFPDYCPSAHQEFVRTCLSHTDRGPESCRFRFCYVQEECCP